MSPGANGAGDGEFPIRSADRREQVDEWALVLAAEGLHPRITRNERGSALTLPGNEAELAERILTEWERENPPRPETPEPAAPIAGPAPWRVAVLVSTAVLGFFRITGPRRGHSEWFEVGAADADLILAGEWWRVVTALTLHADLAHVLGNCLAGAFFLTAVGRSLGPGLALALTVAAGALGNLANALLHGGDHSSVGASTAVFGAVGLLAGLGVGSLRRAGTPARRIWLPVGAGLALVAMLGTGARVDIWAHVMGVVCGAALGVVVWRGHSWRPGPWIQWLAGTAAIALIVVSWSWGWELTALHSADGDALVSAVDAPQSAPTSPRPRGVGAGDEPLPSTPTPRSTQSGRAAPSPAGRQRRLRLLRRRAKRALRSPLLGLAGWIVPQLYRAYMALVWRTSRIEDLGVAGVEPIRAAHAGVVTLLWHEEILSAAYAYRRLGFRPHTLASVSDSGQLVTRVLESCGYRVFRGGSSRRRSRRRHTVLMEMAAHMRERTDVIYGITVDGSHGPAYQMKWGGVVIARQTGRPIVLVRTWTRRHLRLRSWDRLAIPLPWNEIRLSMRGPYPIPEDADTPDGFARFCGRLEADLQTLAAESYEALGQPLPQALREARGEKTR